MAGYTVTDYSDNAEQVAEASASAASATSLYLDQAAAWFLLLPEKLKHLAAAVKAMSRDDIALWVSAFVVLIIAIDFLFNRKKIFERVRANWLSSAGMLIGGIWYVFFNGLSAVVYK